jgi:hypothetical protein
MLRKKLPYFFILSLVGLLVFALAFDRTETRADLIEFYISIDESELQQVISAQRAVGKSFDLQIRSVTNGIAVAKTESSKNFRS